MELSITPTSEVKVLKYGHHLAVIDGKPLPKRANGKLIQAASLHYPDGICFTNRSFFPIQCPNGTIQGGDGVTFNMLIQLGVKEFACRYNHDRDLATIKVK